MHNVVPLGRELRPSSALPDNERERPDAAPHPLEDPDRAMIAASTQSISPLRVAAALLAAVLTMPAGQAQEDLGSPLPTLAPLIEKVSPSVVNISVTVRIDSPLGERGEEMLRRFFPGPRGGELESDGSGVIVDAANGYVLTNHHVVDGADRITVSLFDNRVLDAEVVGSDQGSDVAVLRVPAEGLEQIAFGDVEKLRVGDYVVAIGNPFGFSHTVTSGIVSGLGRSNPYVNNDVFEDFIQTDASINPGNSGGALVNLRGELVGINSAIISRTGQSLGIGFAIPVNMARDVMEQLIATGRVSRGLLGITMTDLAPEAATRLGLRDLNGALVVTLAAGSGAEQAGLRVDDVIVAVNGKAVRDSNALKNAVSLLRPGTEVEVGFVRAGRPETARVTLGERETTARPEALSMGDLDEALTGVEVAVMPAPPGALNRITVVRVADGSRAAESGLRVGDVITHVNGTRVDSFDSVAEVLDDAAGVLLRVRRENGREVPIEIR